MIKNVENERKQGKEKKNERKQGKEKIIVKV